MSGPSSHERHVAARPELVPTSFILFICMFAGQAGVIALSPVLPDVAADFGVSVATAGQLRAVSGLVAGSVALLLGPITRRVGLRDLLILGLSLLALGSLISGAAPSFAVLAVGQVPLGAGLAIVISASTAGAAEWVSDRRHAATLSWTLIGPPASWMVGLPIIGALGAITWRLGWIALPFAASLVGLAALATRRSDPPRKAPAAQAGGLLGDLNLSGWALGELLALSAWAGTVVYAGALMIQSYDIGPGTAGWILGAGAAAYLPGNFIARRWVGQADRLPLIALALSLGACVAVFGLWRPALAVSAAVFALTAFFAGGRTILGSAFGLVIAPDRRLQAMRLRTAALQLGYLFGSAAGGIALSRSGYGAVGITYAALFGLAAVPHLIAQPLRP